MPITAFKKKLYALNPAHPPQYVETQSTRRERNILRADPLTLERDVRQHLADKISGSQVGVWLLLPEHLRLGTWDLLRGWSGQSTERLEPRLALHLVNEAVMCSCSRRERRTLSLKGFELANGLPFVPSDGAIHDLLAAHSVEDGQRLQIALGKLRRAGGHFKGRLLALDPHRMPSSSRRRMRLHRFNAREKPSKMGQTFFLLDAETCQPLCFTLGSSALSTVQATPPLLALAEQILSARGTSKPLLVADKEHYSEKLFRTVSQQGNFELLCALPAFAASRKRWESCPQDGFTEHWAGYATCTQPYQFKTDPTSQYYEMVQRSALRPEDLHYQGFLGTVPLPELSSLSEDYPARWSVEEFFKFNQALGWHRAGTLNLNIRYGQLCMSLVAQAALHQLRQRLGPPVAQWDAEHLAENLFEALDGDVRVRGDTIIVTFYNAPNVQLLRNHYEHLPQKLHREGISPHIPWLYNFKLDFRFK